MSKDLTFVILKDRTSVAQGKQMAVQDGVRVGFVLKHATGKGWDGYIAGRPEVIGSGPSREKALADAREKLDRMNDPAPAL